MRPENPNRRNAVVFAEVVEGSVRGAVISFLSRLSVYKAVMDLSLVKTLDGLAAKAVPAEQVKHAGGWLVRRSPGLSLKRANSVFPRDDPARSVLEVVRECERYYGERGLPTRFQISRASRPHELTGVLLARGYRSHSVTATYVCDLAGFAGLARRAGCEVELLPTPGLAWWAVHNAAVPITSEQQDASTAMFKRIVQDTVFVSVAVDGVGAGVGMGVLERSWFGIFSIATAPSMRRRGVGRVVVDALMDWALSQGAQRGYVQVEAKNDPALALYDRAGYTEHVYDYQYLTRE